MKLGKILGGIVTILIVVGFVYLAVTDIPIEKTMISTTIPNERFFDAG